MKAPLRHIQAYLEFLQEAIDSSDTKAMNAELEVLKESTNGLDHLIDDTITYLRVTSEKKRIDDVDLNRVVDQVISTLSPLISSNNVHIQRSTLPVLRGDSGLLTHLFQNLIGNACKYTDKDKPVVEISHQVEGKHCVISIRDNGIGFGEQYIDRIFAPFKRLVTKGQYEGTGLGLSICKMEVVLIVEGDTGFARILLDNARENGFKGVVATSGDAGVLCAQEYKPDAIILDINLPVMNGWTVLDRIKHDVKIQHIPVHIVSGDDVRQRILKHGA